jgi:hypothetical protein
MYVGFISAILLALAGILVVATRWQAVIIFQVATILFTRWFVDDRFKEPVISALLHPI